jgi:hypothetical protein
LELLPNLCGCSKRIKEIKLIEQIRQTAPTLQLGGDCPAVSGLRHEMVFRRAAA